MLAHLSAYYTLPSASFPPAAVALGFVLARCAAAFALKLTGKWCSNEQASKCTDGNCEGGVRGCHYELLDDDMHTGGA